MGRKPKRKPKNVQRPAEPCPASGPDVIIQFDHKPGNSDTVTIAGMRGAMKHQFSRVNGGLYTIPTAALNGISHNPHVLYISPDRKVAAHLDEAAATVGANLAYQFSVNGAGVGVAVIDSGIANHDDLAGSVVYRQSWTNAGHNRSYTAPM